jgi:hypothetical protein
MQVKKEVGQHDHHAITAVNRRWMPEDTLPDLRIPNNFTQRRHAYNRLQKT